MVNKNIKNITSILLVFALVASCFTIIMTQTANAANPNANNKTSVTFEPDTSMRNIPWDYIRAHKFYDAAFYEGRVPGLPDASHIQLGDDTVRFYGYYTGRYSDYVYYKESDATEKTFKFNTLFSIYQDESTLTPQRWHSLRSVGFLVNCIDNDDEIISGFYFSFEPKTGYNAGGASQIVVRYLDNMDFNQLYEQSNLITDAPNSREVAKIDLENAVQTDEYEIKSSNQAFSVTKNGEEIFSLDISNIDNPQISSTGEIVKDFQIPKGYTGGNDFGFYASYMGSEDGHTCTELSFAEFSNIALWTKSLIPDISEVSWNNGNGNGNGNGINQLIVNGITLKSSENYVEPENFADIVAKTVLAKNDPTAIYTVIGRTTNDDNGGQYEKVYHIKIGLFENGAWKVYAGLLSVNNPGGNEEVQPING